MKKLLAISIYLAFLATGLFSQSINDEKVLLNNDSNSSLEMNIEREEIIIPNTSSVHSILYSQYQETSSLEFLEGLSSTKDLSSLLEIDDEIVLESSSPEYRIINNDDSNDENPIKRKFIKAGLGLEMEIIGGREYPRLAFPHSEFFDFSGYQEKGEISLKWDINTFENISHFTLEFSQDNIVPFVEIAQIDEAENITQSEFYGIIHEKSYSDVNYYRLTAFDMDGAIIGSKTIDIEAIQFQEGELVSVYPNPNNGGLLYCEYGAVQEGTTNINITDANGQIFLAKTQKVFQGKNIFSLYINTLPKGVYSIMVSDCEKITSQRFVVTK